MNSLLSLPTVDRCCVFKVENGGGLINSTVPLYYTVLHEVVGDNARSTKNELQRVLLAEEDVKNILTVIRNDHASILIERILGVQAALKLSHLISSQVHFLKATKTAIYFFSASSASTTELDKDTLLTISLTADKIKTQI